ncbi:Lon protease, N-terminal domain [Dillenia turbinata]|uniref:Protein cereblon n=1 Tax=Dillenia turbinata TaxID=194707 RepID=A0AAN8V4F5_9MAGN
MDDERILERERFQIQQIRELDDEELQVEEVDDVNYSDDDDAVAPRGEGYREDDGFGEFTFNTCLASLHTYLGDVDDTHHRVAFLNNGAVLTLPLFYLEGVVLFPEATLPLRVVQSNFIAAVERALNQVDAPYTIGVVHVHRNLDNDRIKFAAVGTTAEIRQYRRLEDGSLNVVTRGQQRFHLKRRWIDVEGVPCGEVQIIQEDLPLRTPRDAFGKLPSLSKLRCHNLSYTTSSIDRAKMSNYVSEGNRSEAISEESFESELSSAEIRMHRSAIDSCYGCDTIDEATSSDDEKFVCESELHLGRSHFDDSGRPLLPDSVEGSENVRQGSGKTSPGSQSSKERLKRAKMVTGFNVSCTIPKAFWPDWVYRMYDSYSLAQKAADKWRQIVKKPSMDSLVKKPDLLSFHIASKIPVSDSTRQELLEIEGISYRLRREIELLESFDRIRCRNCQTVIARRSDMLPMSSEGPLGAYVNPHGHVHEVMTLYKANSLALVGRPTKEYSWFPGYAWTVTNCATCESGMGWLFTATNRKLKPESFWGIRSSQVADDMR